LILALDPFLFSGVVVISVIAKSLIRSLANNNLSLYVSAKKTIESHCICVVNGKCLDELPHVLSQKPNVSHPRLRPHH